MIFTTKNKGKKYTLIAFYPADYMRPPIKFSQWITDYSLQQGQTQRFLKNKFHGLLYFNLYDKETNQLVNQFKL